MKKMKVLDVVNIYGAFDGVMLQGAPIEDVKVFTRFRREAKPISDAWKAMVQECVEKVKGETMTQEAFNKYLNEALADEANREVEITPFVFTTDGEDVILAQSKIYAGDFETIKAALKPEDKEE